MMLPLLGRQESSTFQSLSSCGARFAGFVLSKCDYLLAVVRMSRRERHPINNWIMIEQINNPFFLLLLFLSMEDSSLTICIYINTQLGAMPTTLAAWGASA
jgi:hypothetical protein